MDNCQSESLSMIFSPRGEQLLDNLTKIASKERFEPSRLALAIKDDLRKEFRNCLPLAIDIVCARQAAARSIEDQLIDKNWLQKALLTRNLLEQATAPVLASHHAEAFKGCKRVLEIGTGAGFDTMAIAKKAKEVISIEIDPVAAAFAEHNFNIQGLSNIKVLTGDAANLIKELDLKSFDGLWWDPARRSIDGTRIFNPEAYRPPLSFILSLPFDGLCGIKISPGVNLGISFDTWEREWIGYKKECREQILWQGAQLGGVKLSLFSPNYSSILKAADENGDLSVLADPGSLIDHYLIEPHAALIRSGALASWAKQNNFTLLDPKIAYLSKVTKPCPSPLYRSFYVTDSFSFSLKHLNQRLKDLGWSKETEIKKRAFPEDSDTIKKKLKFQPSDGESSDKGVIFFTKIGASRHIFMARRVD